MDHLIEEDIHPHPTTCRATRINSLLCGSGLRMDSKSIIFTVSAFEPTPTTPWLNELQEMLTKLTRSLNYPPYFLFRYGFWDLWGFLWIIVWDFFLKSEQDYFRVIYLLPLHWKTCKGPLPGSTLTESDRIRLNPTKSDQVRQNPTVGFVIMSCRKLLGHTKNKRGRRGV